MVSEAFYKNARQISDEEVPRIMHKYRVRRDGPYQKKALKVLKAITYCMMQVDSFEGKSRCDSIARQHIRQGITAYATMIDAIDADIGVDAAAAHSNSCKTNSQNAA